MEVTFFTLFFFACLTSEWCRRQGVWGNQQQRTRGECQMQSQREQRHFILKLIKLYKKKRMIFFEFHWNANVHQIGWFWRLVQTREGEREGVSRRKYEIWDEKQEKYKKNHSIAIVCCALNPHHTAASCARPISLASHSHPPSHSRIHF